MFSQFVTEFGIMVNINSNYLRCIPYTISSLLCSVHPHDKFRSQIVSLVMITLHLCEGPDESEALDVDQDMTTNLLTCISPNFILMLWTDVWDCLMSSFARVQSMFNLINMFHLTKQCYLLIPELMWPFSTEFMF